MKTFESWRAADVEIVAVLRLCREAVRSVVSDASLILFGSYSRGEGRSDSDLDFLILADEISLDMEDKIRDVLFPIELETGRVFSLFFESRKKWTSSLYQAMPFVRAVEAEGVVL